MRVGKYIPAEGWEIVRYYWDWGNVWVYIYGIFRYGMIRKRPKFRVPVIQRISHNRSYEKDGDSL